VVAKIIDYSQISVLSKKFHNDNKNIILVTGVFDLLHQAHLKFLQLAKKQGDTLFVGLESDLRVKKIKDISRPVNNLTRRIEQISKLKFVDFVFGLPEIFDIKAQENLIRNLKPSILTISSHTKHKNCKKNIVEKYGGKVKVIMKKDAKFSTTKIINGSIS
jgi:rfaE bifunctional protein nucleotidyltransferase chain/domain